MDRPETIDQLLASAWQHSQAGRLPEAERLYRHILAREPQHPKALRLLGAVRMELGDAVAAVALVKQSLALLPDNAFAYYHLGLAHAKLGEPDAAAASYRRSIEPQPAFARTYNNLRRSDDPVLNLAVARAWSRDLVRRMRGRGIEVAFDHASRRYPQARLRIGYLLAGEQPRTIEVPAQ